MTGFVLPSIAVAGCFAVSITLRLLAARIGDGDWDSFTETGRADSRGHVADTIEWLARMFNLAGLVGTAVVVWQAVCCRARGSDRYVQLDIRRGMTSGAL